MSTHLEEHAATHALEYRKIRSLYEELSDTISTIIRGALKVKDLRVHSVEGRAKTVESFEKKASKPQDEDPEKPRYPDPLREITDKTGIRVITFLPRDVELACQIISGEFDVIEKTDKAAALIDEGKFGYQSIHFLARLSSSRTALSEYNRFSAITFEIQVRTILQHAWAEMEHDIQYKSSYTIPKTIKKRFIALAGMLEIADREFQNLQDDDESLRKSAQTKVASGNYQAVEITADSLKAYLDKRLGSDGRMNRVSYEITAGQLRKLGFQSIKQIDSCIDGLDGDAISRVLWGNRQGQLTRFDGLLMAGMGDIFTQRHPWGKHEYWAKKFPEQIKRLRDNQIVIRSYDPLSDIQPEDLA